MRMVSTAVPDMFAWIEQARQGDKAACDRVVEANLGLVHSVVKKFLNRGCDPEDLFQIGCIGLIKAVNKFDTTFGVQFSTYAVPMIAGEIKRFLRDDGIVKVSRSLKELAGKAQVMREALRARTGEEPTIYELAEELEVDAEELVMALDASAAPQSLYAPAGEEDSRVLMDRIADEEDTVGIVDKLALTELIGRLSPRERQIIVMRYYQQKTQSEIASVLHISQVQVSRLEKKILARMRDDL